MRYAQIFDTATNQPIGPVHGFTKKEKLPPLPKGQEWVDLPDPSHMAAMKDGVLRAVQRPPKAREARVIPANLEAVQSEDDARAYIQARGVEHVLLELVMRRT